MWFSQSYTHFVYYVMRQSGEDSEWVSKVVDDVHDVLCDMGREARLHRNSFHPLGVVICHSHDVFVSVQCLGQGSSDIKTKPLPRLFHLESNNMMTYHVKPYETNKDL